MEFDELRELLKADRSIRRFDASREIGRDTLLRLIDLTRFCASGRNAQALRYRPVTAPEEFDAVFPLLKWAGYLPDWDGPQPGERPVAYLVQCLDTDVEHDCFCDEGLQLQAITLGARALGIGCCIIKAFNQAELRASLAITDRYSIRYVLALGYPAERVVLEDIEANGGDIRYHRGSDGTHYVPKRRLDELVITPCC